MNKRIICVIANGYAEEMMAVVLMKAMRTRLKELNLDREFMFVGGSLVSSGKWFHDAQFPTFFSGGMTPSGGFPTRSWKGFFSDIKVGALFTPFKLARFIKNWGGNGMELVIAVGDFLLMVTAIPALRTYDVPLVFIPTAKSDYIRSHFKIEKKYIKKYASTVFARDEITTQDFKESGISAYYCGNLMQDLLDRNTPTFSSKLPVVALLPGSREESYGNMGKILDLIELVKINAYWALVQADSLSRDKMAAEFSKRGWQLQNGSDTVKIWAKDDRIIHVYPGGMFDTVALSCDFAISLAGTVGDQIAGLGKPIIGFKGTGPQSSESRMLEYEKLLGESFIYERDFPYGVLNVIDLLLKDPNTRKRYGEQGRLRMGAPGAADCMAEKIISTYFLSERAGL